MKKKSYILVLAAMAAVVVLAGCEGKKQGNNEEADNASTDMAAEEVDSADDTIDIGSGVEVPGEVLEFDVSDFVKLGDYKGLEVTYPSVSDVSEEDVQEEIQYELEEETEYKEVKERGAKEGDIVNIDFTGTIDGEEFEGGSAEESMRSNLFSVI